MCVRQDDRIDLSCRHRRVLPVALAPLLLTLEEPAIDEYLKTVLSTAIRSDVDQVFGTSDGARSAQKLDIGQRSSSNNNRTYHGDRSHGGN